MGRKEEFDKCCMESCNPDKVMINEHNSVYFNNHGILNYRDILIDKLDEKHVREKFNRELTEEEYITKMCSATSSARLCFLYFFEKQGIEYEKKLTIRGTDNKYISSAYLDAYDESSKTYYECKCHEICDSTPKFSEAYLAIIRKRFGIDLNLGVENTNSLYEQFGIDYTRTRGDFHFNFKQFICHLLALAGVEGDKYLQYIFFVPSDNKWEDLYAKLKNEISAIAENKIIQQMCVDNFITLLDPVFVPITSVIDYVLESIHKP